MKESLIKQIPRRSGGTGSPAPAEFSNAPGRRRNSGVALIIVLGMLVLLWIIVVAKINMNYQIAPFTYSRRDTGLRAVLSSVKITALDPNATTSNGTALARSYKPMGSLPAGDGGGGQGISIKKNIDIDKTLLQFDYRFSRNAPFRSASEICDIPLVPTGQSITTMSDIDNTLQSFWNGNAGTHASGGLGSVTGHWLTGDNNLERRYALIYPRLTTKSNTYTVHVRVQSLKKAPTTAPNVFEDGKDQVTGEFRGSFMIERYLEPGNTGFAIGSGTVSSSKNELTFNAQLGQYKFRIVSSKQFTL